MLLVPLVQLVQLALLARVLPTKGRWLRPPLCRLRAIKLVMRTLRCRMSICTFGTAWRGPMLVR